MTGHCYQRRYILEAFQKRRRYRPLCLYIDGELDISQETSGRISVNNAPVHIGSNSEKEGFLWNGIIDDVRIYSYALTADEVGAIYDSAITTSAE